MQASIGQYSMQAGEPAQPVQQSVVIARILGFFLRVALPSPCDIGKCFSRIEIFPCAPFHVSRVQLNFNMARTYFSILTAINGSVPPAVAGGSSSHQNSPATAGGTD